MKKRTVLILLLVVLSLSLLFTCCSKESTFESTIQTLTSDSMNGRLAGNIGNEKAIDFIVQQYKEIDLVPFSNSSYLQSFPMKTYDLGTAKIQLGIQLRDQAFYTCSYGKDYLERNKLQSAHITAPITLNPHDVDLEEKILVLENTDNLSEVKNIAKAILQKTELFTSNAIAQSQGTPILQISPELFEYIKSNNVEWISIDSDINVIDSQVNNIIGIIPGKDHSKAIVVSAHFDHAGYAGDTIFRGAADNAAGSTVLLEVARLLKDASKTQAFPHDIIIAAINGEEHGRLGSKALIPALKDKYKSFYNINIDTIGSKASPEVLLEGDDHFNEALKSDLSQFFIGSDYSVDSNSKGYISDNLSFEEAGFCAVNIGQADITTLHSKEDTISNLDIVFLQKISKTIADFIISNKDVVYENKNDSTKLDTLSAEFLNEQRKYEGHKLENLSFDEFMLSEFQGVTLFISGSNKSLDKDDLTTHYPKMKIPQQVDQFAFKKIRFISLQKGTDLTNIMSSKDKYQLETKYKRDISKEHFISAHITYAATDENLTIAIIKEREDINYESPFDISPYEKLSADNSFGIINNDGHLELVKIMNVNGCNYLVKIESSPVHADSNDKQVLSKLYELQKKISFESLIQNIFMQ